MADVIQLNETFEEDCFDFPLEALNSNSQIFLVCLYSATSFAAFIGNVTVILVEAFGKQSATNLRKFLINLAISDIIIGVFCVPFIYTDFMLGRWIFPHVMCPIAQFMQLLSVFVTSFTLTVIGIERWEFNFIESLFCEYELAILLNISRRRVLGSIFEKNHFNTCSHLNNALLHFGILTNARIQ